MPVLRTWDYRPIEPAIGHAERLRGEASLAETLMQLVDERWVDLEGALALVHPLMNGNPRRVFKLDEKAASFRKAFWLPS